jgi:hypothetical protein
MEPSRGEDHGWAQQKEEDSHWALKKKKRCSEPDPNIREAIR